MAQVFSSTEMQQFCFFFLTDYEYIMQFFLILGLSIFLNFDTLLGTWSILNLLKLSNHKNLSLKKCK
jgi:hypothetical protein